MEITDEEADQIEVVGDLAGSVNCHDDASDPLRAANIGMGIGLQCEVSENLETVAVMARSSTGFACCE